MANQQQARYAVQVYLLEHEHRQLEELRERLGLPGRPSPKTVAIATAISRMHAQLLDESSKHIPQE